MSGYGSVFQELTYSYQAQTKAASESGMFTPSLSPI
jgi:hypothetical protein